MDEFNIPPKKTVIDKTRTAVKTGRDSGTGALRLRQDARCVDFCLVVSIFAPSACAGPDSTQIDRKRQIAQAG